MPPFSSVEGGGAGGMGLGAGRGMMGQGMGCCGMGFGGMGGGAMGSGMGPTGMNPMGGCGMGAMNPMMPMMPHQGGMGPVMGQGHMGPNPMMMMMGMMMGMQSGVQGTAHKADSLPAAAVEGEKHIDQRVRTICNNYGINLDTCKRLHDAMKEREDYDEDLQALHKVMERKTKDGQKPLEVMLQQIRNIRSNKFPGKDLLDTDIWDFVCKYNLDDRVMNLLIDTLNQRAKGKRKETLQALNDRMAMANQATGVGLLVRFLEGLAETGRLPSPPKRLGGSGAFRPTGTFLHPETGRARGRDRSPQSRRSRSRRRRDSRSRGRR